MSLTHLARPLAQSSSADASHDPALHTWRLSGVDYEDGLTTRCFECTGCGAVRYS